MKSNNIEYVFSLNSARKAANALAKRVFTVVTEISNSSATSLCRFPSSTILLKTSRVRSGKRSTALYN